ncbi:MAG: AEC family transporter, partial [Clostridia bacterium]|nr:AEC family transporter [Clostridia bacterium]
MNLSGVINQLISLFLMMLMGFLVAKAGIVSPEFRKKLSTFTLNTAAPCIIISSVLESDSQPSSMI